VKSLHLIIIATLLLLPVIVIAGGCEPLAEAGIASFHRQPEYHFDDLGRLNGLSLCCWIENPTGAPLWILERYDPLATEAAFGYLTGQNGVSSRLVCWSEPLNTSHLRERLPQAVLNCSIAGVDGYLLQPAYDAPTISSSADLFACVGLAQPGFPLSDYSGIPLLGEGERGLVLWLEDGATVFLGSLPHRTDDYLTRRDALGYLNRSLRNGGLNGVKEARVIPVEYQGRTGYLLVAKTSTSLLLFDEKELLIASRFASTSVDNRISLLTPWVELLF